MSTDIVIVSAARTAVGSFNGAFANVPAHELGAAAIKAALERAKVAAGEVDEVILGQVLTAGAGPEPRPPGRDEGRHSQTEHRLRHQPALRLGPARRRARPAADRQSATPRSSSPAARKACRSSPHAAHLRTGMKMGDVKFVDTMLNDGLTDAFHGYHMGMTAENIAAKWQITREEQDEFAVASQNKAEAAQKAGKFKDEIVPFTISTKKGDIVVDSDEYIRTASPRRRLPSCARPSPRTARSPPATPRASTTAPPPWC